MKNVTKAFEREDGYIEYLAVVGKEAYSIEEWKGTFTVYEWFRDNEFKTLEDAVLAIKDYRKKKGD